MEQAEGGSSEVVQQYGFLSKAERRGQVARPYMEQAEGGSTEVVLAQNPGGGDRSQEHYMEQAEGLQADRSMVEAEQNPERRGQVARTYMEQEWESHLKSKSIVCNLL